MRVDADLLAGLPSTGLDFEWREFRDQLAQIASSLAGSRLGLVTWSCLLSLMAAAIAGEIARKQLRRAPVRLNWATICGGKGGSCLSGDDAGAGDVP